MSVRGGAWSLAGCRTLRPPLTFDLRTEEAAPVGFAVNRSFCLDGRTPRFSCPRAGRRVDVPASDQAGPATPAERRRV